MTSQPVTRKALVSVLDEILTPYKEHIDTLEKELAGLHTRLLDMGDLSDKSLHDLNLLITEKTAEPFRNPEAFRGEKGAIGKRGERGPRGDIGERGVPGSPGSRGERGFPGKDGADGRDGEVGLRGKQGVRGDIGPMGVPGKDGDIGPRGTQGPRGEIGGQGIPGKDGHIGERGDKGERGDPGTEGKRGKKGKQGETGMLLATEPWREREHQKGELVTHKGGSWQARRPTTSEPDINSNAWEVLGNGVDEVVSKGTHLEIIETNGTVTKTADLRGEKGDPGESITTHTEYDELRMYRAGLDEVKESGGVWRAMKTGILHRPGSAKGKEAGQWLLIAHRGQKGEKGKDADEAAIAERVIKELLLETQGILDSTALMVDEFVNGLPLDN